jgi:hypothetical protein
MMSQPASIGKPCPGWTSSPREEGKVCEPGLEAKSASACAKAAFSLFNGYLDSPSAPPRVVSATSTTPRQGLVH